MCQPVSKSILANKYSLSMTTIQRLLNKVYFKELSEVGYRKEMRILPPLVVKKFVELYGSPDDNEI